MLPGAYYLPVAVLLILGGFIACFLGYRLFKFVLAIFGFILGALAASSVFGVSDTTPMVIAAIVGGAAGALLLLAAYFVGVALVGAGLGALLANLVWTQIEGDPHPFVIVLFSVAGRAPRHMAPTLRHHSRDRIWWRVDDYRRRSRGDGR